MLNPQIKICGIRHPGTALFAAHQGADYIGLVFCPDSSRYIDPATAIEICLALKNTAAKPVAVFRQQPASVIIALTEKLGIDTVQLHGSLSLTAAQHLPAHLKRIIAIDIDQNGDIQTDLGILPTLDPEQDRLLFDNPNPGSGQQPRLDRLHFQQFGFKYFIAGGLQARNLIKVIKRYRPNGIDVSSGIEIRPGVKSRTLIAQFIHTANSLGVRP